MSGANYEDVQKPNISHGWSVHITCCTICMYGFLVCVHVSKVMGGELVIRYYNVIPHCVVRF